MDLLGPPAVPVKSPVTWTNVLIALSLILFDLAISSSFRLGITRQLLVAAARCILQLSLMGLVLDSVFRAESPWAVAAMSGGMLLLGANEVTFARLKKRPQGLFLSTLFSLACSVLPIATIGAKFAIVRTPFWAPQSFIPVLGMICGNAISGTAVATNFVVRELTDNRDKVETYLAFGASRMEACLPLARDALRLALLPTVNQMSVIGLISIPGMMTGAILGGESVEQAAKMQMVIMFLITATSTLCVSISLILTLSVLVDSRHRIRLDRVQTSGSPVGWIKGAARRGWSWVCGCGGRGRVRLEEEA